MGVAREDFGIAVLDGRLAYVAVTRIIDADDNEPDLMNGVQWFDPVRQVWTSGPG